MLQVTCPNCSDRAEMLYVLIEAQRAWLAQKENGLLKRGSRSVSEDKGEDLDLERSHLGVTAQPLTKQREEIQDSEWLSLNPQKLAWAKASTDPRIAVGQQSPLEKRILDLGGVHTAAARHLITQLYQEEHKTLCKEQARSLDHWLARAESYYNKKLLEMRRKEELDNRAKTEMEGKATKSKVQKQCSCVPEREKQQIERHIHRTYQAREFRSKPSRQPQLSREVVLPKIMSEKQSVSEAQRRKQAHRRERMQIQGHQARMARGRKLLEEKLQRRVVWKSPSLLLPPPKRPPTVRETKEFERITAYPLFQPRNTSRIKVDILIDKSRYGEEVCRVIRPYQKKFLAVPPFLRSQLGKMED